MTAWALFSGVVGALLVFVAGILREEWRNDRETVGILRLLQAEIEHNDAAVRTLDYWRNASVVNIDMRLLPLVKAEVWQGVRVRAAQLLPELLARSLNDYYSPLENVVTLRGLQDDPKKLDLSNHILMNALGKRDEGQDTPVPVLYVDNAVRALQAQTEAGNRIEEYLALPAWTRYPTVVQLVSLLPRKQDVRSQL